MQGIVSGQRFIQELVDQQPSYDKRILYDIRPTDGWIGHVAVGTFESATGTQHTRDRFNHVEPDVTAVWDPVGAAHCLGTPCDFKANRIGWGSTRLVYSLEEQTWITPLLCYDQELHITHAREQFRYIISDILKPATSTILSGFFRKRGAQWVDNRTVANRNFATPAGVFNFNWVSVVGADGLTRETYIDTNTPPGNVFKLTPQMLARYVEPLLRVGYLGKMPFKDKRPPMLELVTDLQTCWELDRLGGSQGIGGGNNPTVIGNWRFEQWDATSKYWAYGFGGQIGNYAVRVDPKQLRFNYVGVVGGKYRYQVVTPYVNVPSSGAGGAAGLKSISNPDYDNAQYRWTYIWHQKVIEALVLDPTPVNPEMPYGPRDFGGKWQFKMHDLGTDSHGVVIENILENKGLFVGQFKLAIAPMWTEFGVLIFHRGEPSCIYEISACNPDPGYPTQNYSSANTECPEVDTSEVPSTYTTTNTPVATSDGATYEIEANSIECDGAPIEHPAVTGTATLAALVAQLNSILSVLGVWTVVGGTIVLVGTCKNVGLPWLSAGTAAPTGETFGGQ